MTSICDDSYFYRCSFLWASLVAQIVKNLLPVSVGDAGAVGSNPGQEDPLKEVMATHSSILAWEIPWIEEPGGL